MGLQALSHRFAVRCGVRERGEQPFEYAAQARIANGRTEDVRNSDIEDIAAFAKDLDALRRATVDNPPVPAVDDGEDRHVEWGLAQTLGRENDEKMSAWIDRHRRLQLHQPHWHLPRRIPRAPGS